MFQVFLGGTNEVTKSQIFLVLFMVPLLLHYKNGHESIFEKIQNNQTIYAKNDGLKDKDDFYMEANNDNEVVMFDHNYWSTRWSIPYSLMVRI